MRKLTALWACSVATLGFLAAGGCPENPLPENTIPVVNDDNAPKTDDADNSGVFSTFSRELTGPPYASGPMSPFGVGFTQVYVIDNAPLAATDVSIRVLISADIGAEDETVSLTMNGTPLALFFTSKTDCNDPPSEALIELSRAEFNTIRGQNSNIAFEFRASNTVNPNQCIFPTSVSIGVNYCGGPDCNGNGVPDNCDINDGTSEDANNNGIPDECELVVANTSPIAGSIDGGTMVTFTGTGFLPGTSVRFGNLASPDVNIVNALLMTAVTPPGEAGYVNIVIENPVNGTVFLKSGFLYLNDVPPNDGTDTDGDGVTDYDEVVGWEIAIDEFGLGFGTDSFGNVTRYRVTSDPNNPDTDGDGLNDAEERFIRSDPRMKDSDKDGLEDGEEWNRWLTSPITIDTDGDARGPNHNLPPNASLFDGQELYTSADLELPSDQRTIKPRATSPSLDDTDGDGVSDFDEYDSPVRSPVIADLPEINFEVVDNINVRLNVEYADAQGVETSYGTEVSRGTSTSHSRSDTESITKSWEVNGNVGFDGWKLVGSVGSSYGQQRTLGTEINNTSAQESAQANSEALAQSRERTVTNSSGSISLGLRATNTGSIAYTLNGISIVVRQFIPRLGTYRSLTALVPPEGADSFTLSPGDTTSVIPLRDDAVDAGLITGFLVNPSSLLLEPTGFGLLNSEGTSFAFETEQTLGRTALIVVDFGDGAVEKYRIATNIERASDATYSGISLGHALNELAIPFATALNNDGGPSDGLRRLVQVRTRAEEAFAGAAPNLGDPAYPIGREPGPRNFKRYWILVAARGNNALEPLNLDVDFDQIVLKARDEIRLVYVKDEDRDGLHDRQEFTVGTSEADLDSDDDTLSDFYEAYVGWTVAIQGPNAPQPYEVYPNPLVVDADGDGWDDRTEAEQGTDPHNPDTDDDTVPDSLDEFPLTPALTLYVNANASPGGNGFSWAQAFQTLTAANDQARAFLADADPSNDVRQIWVAAGTYVGSWNNHAGDHRMVDGVSVYGGFVGNETLRAQRDPNPASNGTLIRNAVNDNARAVTFQQIGAAEICRLDGFTIESPAGGGAIGVFTCNNVELANLIVRDSVRDGSGGAAYFLNSTATIENCQFLDNTAAREGGALMIQGSTVTMNNCQFINNQVTLAVTLASLMGGGAINATLGADITCSNSVFRSNRIDTAVNAPQSTAIHGGAVLMSGGTSRFTNCSFQDNVLGANGMATGTNRAGGAMAFIGGRHALTGCVFFRNTAIKAGGGLYVIYSPTIPDPPDVTVRVVNCSFVRNQALSFETTFSSGGGIFDESLTGGNNCGGGCGTSLFNSILWGNTVGDPNIQGSEREQVGTFSSLAPVIIANNCAIQNLGAGNAPVIGNANISQNPLFQNEAAGDTRLRFGSPCIDSGNRVVDADITLPGVQPLPATDVNGNPRIVDGDGNGNPEVDMGANEYQGG